MILKLKNELAAAERALVDCVAWAKVPLSVPEPTHPVVKAVKRLREEADASARVRVLYSDALNVIAHHPGGDEVSEWMKAKALEALGKTEAAERGDIYAQVASTDEEESTAEASRDVLKSLFAKLSEVMGDPEQNQALKDAVMKRVKERLHQPRTQRIPFEPFEHRCAGVSRADVAEMIAAERERLIEAMERVLAMQTDPFSRSKVDPLGVLVAELRKVGG